MKTNKRLIRLTENDLHRIVKNSVNKILKEETDETGQEWSYDEAVEQLETSLALLIGHKNSNDASSLYKEWIEDCNWLLQMFPNTNIGEIIDSVFEREQEILESFRSDVTNKTKNDLGL